MKKYTVIFLIIFITSISFGVDRGALYRRFGPVIIEAVVLVIKDEINLLRAEAGLPERTNQQMLNAIETKLDSVEKYEWMNE